jgi:hypothetical protein
MVSSTIIIVVVVVILVIIFAVVGVVLYLRSKNGGATGATGITGVTGTCATNCTIIPQGCISSNQLLVGFTGANCPTTCTSTPQPTAFSGCVAPSCGSNSCAPQQALYTNVNSNNSLFLTCNSGATGTGFPSNACVDPTTSGVYLNSLVVTPSSINNNQIFPIFITTIQGSIYQPTQPATPPGVDPETIKVSTDPTVVNDPYLMHWNNTNSFITLKRLSDIKANFNITDAMWVYNTDNNTLIPFNNIANLNTNLAVPGGAYTDNIPIQGLTYFGQYPPCSYTFFDGDPPGNGDAQSIVYDGSNGWFQFQVNTLGSGNSVNVSGYLRPTNSSITDPNGFVNNNIISTSDYNPSVYFGGGTCGYSDYTRWYSISAINEYL